VGLLAYLITIPVFASHGDADEEELPPDAQA
jgi:hypothetical protein